MNYDHITSNATSGFILILDCKDIQFQLFSNLYMNYLGLHRCRNKQITIFHEYYVDDGGYI